MRVPDWTGTQRVTWGRFFVLPESPTHANRTQRRSQWKYCDWTISTESSSGPPSRGALLIVALLALWALWIGPSHAQDTVNQEADQLAKMLKWHTGSVVAEIGAGKGEFTLAAAKRVGPTGTVYATELDTQALLHLGELAANAKNIVVVKATEGDTDLPTGCCDSIYLRLVYHHLTRPAEIDASLFRSLRSGGGLAVIDEDPLPGTSIPEGVPENRLGHRVPQKILIRELVAAGFEVERIYNTWPSRDEYHRIYCVLLRKP